MGSTAKPEPVKPTTKDSLSFLGASDPLDFLDEGQTEAPTLDIGQGDPLDFLGSEPSGGVGVEGTVAPVTDAELTPDLQLSDILKRPGITPTQRARIERMQHNQRAAAGQDQEKADNLAVQFALSTVQSALSLPAAVAGTAAMVTDAAKPARDALNEIIATIEPTMSGTNTVDLRGFKQALLFNPQTAAIAHLLPDQVEAQALMQSTGAVAGVVAGAPPVYKASQVIAEGVGQIGKVALPRVAAKAETALAELSARALSRTGSKQLANAILAAPRELAAGAIFQALMEPESMKTVQGVAMATMFGVLGSLGEGVRLTRVVEAEAKVAQAAALVETAKRKNTISDEQAAQIQLKITEAKAEKAAKSAARKAWDAATPEMRRVLLPAAEVDALSGAWKGLPPEAKSLIVAHLRAAASDSKMNKPTAEAAAIEAPGPPATPPPAGGTPVAEAQLIEGGTVDVPQIPGPTSRTPSGLPPAEPLSAPAPTAVPPLAADALTAPTVHVVKQAQDLVGRQEVTRQVASVLKKRKAPPSTPEGMGAIIEAVSRKIVDRQAAGGEKLAAKPGEAPTGSPVTETPEAPRVDAEITRVQSEMQQRLNEAERRVNAAERAAEIDDLTGLGNQNAWGKAVKRIDSDPNSVILLVDVKQMHPYNKRYGQAAGDELLRGHGQSIRESLTEVDQAFRVGGDEFAVVTTPDYAPIMRSKLLAVIKDQPIEGTGFSTGIRVAEGKTYAEASKALIETAAAETGPKSRPVDVVPPAEQVAPPKEPVRVSKEVARDAGFMESEISGRRVDPRANEGYAFVDGQLVPVTEQVLANKRTVNEARVAELKGKLEEVRQSEDPPHPTSAYADRFLGSDSRAADKPGVMAEINRRIAEVEGGIKSFERQHKRYKDSLKAAGVKARPKAKEEPVEKGPRSIKDIDAEIEAAENLHEAGKISDAKLTVELNRLGAEKAALKKSAKLAPVPMRRPVTRGEMDYAATSVIPEGKLKLELAGQIQELRATTDPISRAAVMHDLNMVRREIRLREKVSQLSDEALDTHTNEMKALWEELPVEKRGPIEARLAEIDAEFKKRQKPDIDDIFNDERYTFPGGMFARNLDPLEAKTSPNLPEHSKRIQSRIVIDPQGDKPFPSVKDLFRAIGKGYSHLVRSTLAADQATNQLGLKGQPTVRNPGEWAELLAGSAGRAQRMLAFGPFRWKPDGNLVESGVPGYKAILAPFKGRLNELRRFELSRYTIELLQRSKETGIDLLDAVREVNSAPADIIAAADQSVAFRRAALDYLTDAGMFSAEARLALEKLTQAYVPLYRVLEGKDVGKVAELVGAGVKEKGAIVGVGPQVRRLIGGLMKIVDPIRSTTDQVRRFVRAGDLNRMGQMLVEAAEANPELAKGLIWKETRIKTSLDPDLAKQAESLKEGAKAHGVAISSDVAMELAIGLNSKRLRTRVDQLHFWRDGKRELWAISPELAAMYQSFQPHEMHWMVQALGFIPQMAKTGITDNPVFGIFNAFKDTFDATAQSKYGFRWGIDSITGFLHSITNSKIRQEFLAGAGTAGGIAGRAVGSLEQSVRAILPMTPAERATNLVLHPIDALRELSVPFEEAARLGEFARARGAGAPVMDASIASQRVTTNFRQRGLSMQGISHIVMFLNPAIQSLDTNIRTAIRQPGRLIATMFGAVTLPSIYLWAANRGDKEIEELRKSRFGSGFWFYRKNDGSIGRLPKPFLYGAIFGTGVEDALDAAFDADPTAGDRMVQTLEDQLPYNILPTTLNFTLGLIYNRDFSTGSPIAPDNLESGTGQVEARYRARPETGPTARALGDILNVSPAKIEFAVRTNLGTLGQDILRAADIMNDAKAKYPAPLAAEMPVIGRLLGKYPTSGAFSLRRFYDDAKQIEEVTNTAKLLEKTNPQRYAEYVTSHKREIALAEVYADTRKNLSDLRAETDYLASLPQESMNSQQKRKIIDFVMNKMIELARETNEAVLNATRNIDLSQADPTLAPLD